MDNLGASFFVGVLSSVVAAGVILLATGLVSQRARWVLTATLGRLLDIDTEYVFSTRNAAAPDVQSELAKARSICFLTGRGDELRSVFLAIFQTERKGGVRILLPDPKQVRARDWITQREQEIKSFEPTFKDGQLRRETQSNVDFVGAIAQRGVVSLRLYDLPQLGRVIITERVAYLTTYRHDSHGWHVPVIKYRRGGPMYDWLARLFEHYWESSVDPQPQGAQTDGGPQTTGTE